MPVARLQLQSLMFMPRKVSMPTPRKPATSPESTSVSFDFPEAMRQVILGKEITKLEWGNPQIRCTLKDGHLKIFLLSNNRWNDWIISDGDLMGMDWMVINE